RKSANGRLFAQRRRQHRATSRPRLWHAAAGEGASEANCRHTLRRRAADGCDRPCTAFETQFLLLHQPSMGLPPLVVEQILSVIRCRHQSTANGKDRSTPYSCGLELPVAKGFSSACCPRSRWWSSFPKTTRPPLGKKSILRC